jgi:hypothetical protein
VTAAAVASPGGADQDAGAPLAFTILAGRDAPMTARGATADSVGSWLSGEAGFAFDLLLTEIVTNAVKHGSCRTGAEIRVEAARVEGCVCVEVTNHGAPFAARAVEPETLDTSGRGLMLVDALADRWGSRHHDGATTVWFEQHAA